MNQIDVFKSLFSKALQQPQKNGLVDRYRLSLASLEAVSSALKLSEEEVFDLQTKMVELQKELDKVKKENQKLQLEITNNKSEPTNLKQLITKTEE